MEQIQGRVRVKIKEYVHAWSEFFFVSLLFISFFLFPQINQFYYFTSLHALQDIENHSTHLRDIELKTGRKIPYLRFPHVLLSMQLDWRTWNYKTKKIYLLRIQKKKRTQKQAQKDMNQLERHKMDYLIFSAMRMRKRHLFCISSHHNALSEKQPGLNNGSEPWNESLLERVRNC